MRYALLFPLSFLFLCLLAACGEDSANDPVAEPYAIVLTNRTATNYNVFQSPTGSGSGFSKTGFALSGVNYRMYPLLPGQTYTFRLVRDGGSVDEPDYTRTFSSAGGEEISWVIP